MHHWQDTLLAVCILGFNISLLPTVFGKTKPAIKTSILTSFFQSGALVAYVGLKLWYSMIMSLINLILWSILAIQQYYIAKHNSINT